jgi:hypothetical protein
MGVILKPRLKEGEKFVGRLDEIGDDYAIFTGANEKQYRVQLGNDLLQLLDDDSYLDEIVQIEKREGEFEIEVLSAWPVGK